MPSQTIEERVASAAAYAARFAENAERFKRYLESAQYVQRVQAETAQSERDVCAECESVRAECERRIAKKIAEERQRGAEARASAERMLEELVPTLEDFYKFKTDARAFLELDDDDDSEEEDESSRGGGVTPDPAPSVKVALGASVQFIAPDQIVGCAQCGACFRVGAWTPDESGTVHTRACAGHAGAAAQPPSARWLAYLEKHPVRAAPAPTSPASLKRARTPDASELECEKCSTRAGHTVTHARAQFPTYKKTKGDGSVVLGLRGSCEASIAEERRARDAAKKSTPPQN